MSRFDQMSKEELAAVHRELREAYEEAAKLGLSLNMSRGKPASDQLDLSEALLTALSHGADCRADGMDLRNYGKLEGIEAARAFFGEMLDAPADQVLVGGNSALNMIFDTLMRAMVFGLHADTEPWMKQGGLKFLCPCPGYDRHFAIAEALGMELIAIPMLSDGPDMDAVEQAVADPAVKGIFCVPKYSNPTGITFSDAVVRRFARLSPAAKDFIIVWDNAYAVHDLYEDGDCLLNLLAEAEAQGRGDMVFTYTSTSKVTFPGAGIAAMAASAANIAYHKKIMSLQSIGPDKLNQLRHIRYLPDMQAVKAHMMRHAECLRPKFEIVLNALDAEVAATGTGSYTRPRGGYFISLDVMDGCAARVWQLLADIGVEMTPAGASFPGKKDPRDRNLRIAPTYPTVEELQVATRLLCLCVKLAAAEKLLGL
ncbi:MAG: aminotransferase [Clostridia bacterium]|nr:aminotransferase [Clostridia bacterium]